MTSKALEAAAQALWAFARPDGSPRFIAGLEADRKSLLVDRTADIIRAFADNLSEEAAAFVEGDNEGLCEMCSFWWCASPEQIRAAIAKDLE